MKQITSIILLVLIMGCSQPISNSKLTKPFSLQKNLYISHVTFNNLANQKLHLDEKNIEEKILEQLGKKQNHLSKKATKITINLINIEEQSIKEESTLNIHNVIAVTAMLATGGIADTSSIDTNQVKNSKFILNFSLQEERTKLFIEISNYSDKEELKKLFEAELIHKIEEIF